MRRLTEITKDLRKTLKAAYPKCKFSVTTQHHTNISVALMSAPESPFASLDMIDDRYQRQTQSHDGKHAGLNHYYITKNHHDQWTSNCYHLTPEAAKMLKDVVEIANEENYDKSDLMSDYHCVGFYFHLAIGKWDRPFATKN